MTNGGSPVLVRVGQAVPLLQAVLLLLLRVTDATPSDHRAVPHPSTSSAEWMDGWVNGQGSFISGTSELHVANKQRN